MITIKKKYNLVSLRSSILGSSDLWVVFQSAVEVGIQSLTYTVVQFCRLMNKIKEKKNIVQSKTIKRT